jgi:hypothetical protein
MDQWIVKLAAVCQMCLWQVKWLLLLALITLPLPFASHGQDLHSVKGKVVSQDSEPLMGNVVALSVKDSSFIKGDSFLEGDFELPGLNAKEVLLKLSSLQFQDSLIHITFTDERPVDLGVIVVNDRLQMLKEVEITGSAPLFNARPDGVLEVNVANTVLATSNSVTEILSRSPNIVSDDEGISVFGRGQAILYLNGKRITQDRLSSISASQVKSIEIIANPSAIYDAEGRAVINIITKDDLPEGYRATAQQHVSWSDMAGAMTSTILNFNYKKRKVEVAGHYDLRLGKERERLFTRRTRAPENDYLDSDVLWDRRRDYNNVSNYSLGVSHDLNGRGYASLEYNGSYENIDDETENRNHIITTDEDGLYANRTIREGLVTNNSFTINVNKVFDSLGSSLFAGGQFSQYRSALLDRITEDNVVNGQEVFSLLKSNQGSEVTVFSPQVDFVKAYAGGKLGVGAKLSRVNVLSDVRFYSFNEEDEYEPDHQRSNDFEYRETVPAAYIQYDGVFNTAITYGLGIRSEWTRYTLYTTVQSAGTYSSSYVNVFPNAQVSVALSQHLKLRAAYTSRITRPPYQALSPSLIYQDAFTSIEGNPNLRPEKTHSFELGACLKMFDLKAGHNYTIDPLSGAALRGADEKSYVLKRLNFRKGHSYFTALSASISTRWLTSTNTVSVSYDKFVDDQYDYKQVGVRPQVYAYTSNKIDVGNAFTLQVLAWYLGEKYYGIRYDKDRSMVTLGVEREFFDKFLKCSFTANDIFHKTTAAGTYDVGQTFVAYNRVYNSNYYRLTLTCSFGQLKKTSYKTKSTSEAENSRAR